MTHMKKLFSILMGLTLMTLGASRSEAGFQLSEPTSIQHIVNDCYSMDFHATGQFFAGENVKLGEMKYDFWFRAYYNKDTGAVEIGVFPTQDKAGDSSKVRVNGVDRKNSIKKFLSPSVEALTVAESANKFNAYLESKGLAKIDDLPNIMMDAVQAHEKNHVDRYAEYPLSLFRYTGLEGTDCQKKFDDLDIQLEGEAVIAQIEKFHEGIAAKVKDPALVERYMEEYVSTRFTAKINKTGVPYIKAARDTGKIPSYAVETDKKLRNQKQKEWKKYLRQKNAELSQARAAMYTAIRGCVENHVKNVGDTLFYAHQSEAKMQVQKGRAICSSCYFGDTMMRCSSIWCPNYKQPCSKYVKQPGDYWYKAK